MKKKDISDYLMDCGGNFLRIGRIAICAILAGLIIAAVLLIISLIAYGKVIVFDGNQTLAFFWTLDIVITGLGVLFLPLYFLGLHFLGLGTIAKNTEK